MAQLYLLNVQDYIEPESEEVEENKRVRYEVPKFIKFYSLYQYDREKFTNLLKIWLETEAGKNRTLETLKAKQAEILELCYKRDENGKPLKDSDEKHIYRIKLLNTLRKNKFDYSSNGIHSLIYDYIDKPAMDNRERYEQDGLAIYPQEQQAEILNTWKLPIKQRVIIHIRLLRLLRKGLSIKEALERIKRSVNGYRA